MIRAGLAAATLAAALLLGGCAAGTAAPPSGPTAAAAPAAGSSISATEFAAAVTLPDTVVLDVRTPAEFAEGHLPEAVNLDVSAPGFADSLSGLDPDKTYAVYCRSGNRSRAAMATMQQAGFSRLFDLAGGIGAWTAAGGEIVS